jgi:hypothetical protein
VNLLLESSPFGTVAIVALFFTVLPHCGRLLHTEAHVANPTTDRVALSSPVVDSSIAAWFGWRQAKIEAEGQEVAAPASTFYMTQVWCACVRACVRRYVCVFGVFGVFGVCACVCGH